MQSAKLTVTELNDQLRTTFVGGVVLITAGVEALDAEVKLRLLAAVRSFDRFSADNNPFDEHDFGSVEIDEEIYFFKIDYYDRSMTAHSPDKADPAVTARVLTIMRADEY